MGIPMLARQIARWVGYVAIILLISFGVFESLLRIGGYEPNIKMYDYTLIFDREILFRIKPLSAPDINDMGYRGAHFDHERSDSKRRLLFLGDSFVMGHNVVPGETIAAALGRELDGAFEIFNMGVVAYGPDQSFVQLLNDGLDLNPDMVILGIFPANDFQDIDNNRLFMLDGGGRLTRSSDNGVTKHLPRFRTSFVLDHLQYVLQPKIDPEHRFLSRRYEFLISGLFADFYDWELLYDLDSTDSRMKIDLMRAILSRFKEELSARDIVFSVVIIPSYPTIVNEASFLEINIDEHEYERLKRDDEGFFGPEDATRDLCEELDIPYLNLYPIFLDFDEEDRIALYDDEDWHLSAVGNQVAGDSWPRGS